jgi:type IV pilus assembly protein PilV
MCHNGMTKDSSGARKLVKPPTLQTQSQAGSSLLEVLVAILLVSVGLLGIAGLSGATFGYNKTAQIRLVGLALVNDYADRARVNIYGYDRGGYNLTLAATAPTGTPSYAPDALTNTDAGAQAAADNVATFDRQDFLNAVASRLPGGDAVVVSTPSGNARDMDVWLLWIEPQAGSAASITGSLFNAAQGNCPATLTPAEAAQYSCMYFKVDL